MPKRDSNVMTPLTDLVLDGIEPTVNLSLILATLWIINNDFAKYTASAVNIGQYAVNERHRLYHNDLINEILKRAMIMPHIRFFTESETKDTSDDEELDINKIENEINKQELIRNYFSRDRVICFLDSLTSYENFERELLDPRRYYKRDGYFILIYTGTESNRLAHVKEIFRRLFVLYCTNVNVMLVVGRSPYLYTYFPYAPKKCHSSLPEFHLSFRDILENYAQFQVNKPIFPRKVKNMYGCKLAVSTWTYAPYIYVDKDPVDGKFLRLHGIEGLIISTLSEMMNFKIEIKAPDPLDRGDVYPNGTTTGAAKMIIDQETNITIISLMYNEIRAKVMQPSYSYLAIPYVLAIPQGRKMSSFERILKPFRYIIWSCFSSSLLFAILFIYYIRFLGRTKLSNFIFGSENRIPFTNLLSILFGGSTLQNAPHRNFARYILLVWLMYTFVLRSAYSGALYILLQDGRARNTFGSIDEVIKNNYTIYAFPAVERVIKLAKPDAQTALIDSNNPTTKLYERIANNNEKIALCLLEYSIRAYNQNNPQRRVEVLNEPLLTSPIVFYMPRYSYIGFQADELILRILSAGLVKRYESYYLYSTSQSLRDDKEPVKLSVKLLFALFCIYAVLLALAFLIFLMELASLKSDWCRIIVNFLNL